MADTQGETAAVIVKDDQPSSSSAPMTHIIENLTNGTSWSKASILKLIQLHKEFQYLFDNPSYKKKSVWDMIVAGLKRQGFDYTLAQVENKWKSLTKKYRDAVDHNTKHGHICPRRCAFFTEMSLAYKYTSPFADQDVLESSLPDSKDCNGDDTINNDSNEQKTMRTVSQSALHTPEARRMKRKVEEASLKSLVSDDGVMVSNEAALGKKKKWVHPGVDKKTDVDKILHMLHVMNEDRKKQERLRMDRLEKMHKEKMDVFKEFLSVLKSSVHQSKAKEYRCSCDSSASNAS